MIYDVIIIGSGPAGLTAATYCSRDDLKTLVLGGGKWGGQLMLTTEVDNFPGFPQGIMGPDLMDNMKKQAERFGTEVKLENVMKVDFSRKPFKIETNGVSETYESHAIIIATGADTVWLGVPNEQKLIGKGVSSCAPCDAFFFKNKKVIVVGGGDAAMEEAITLSKFASEVTIVHRRDAFRASKIMQERALSLANVKVIYNTVVTEVLGTEKVVGVELRTTGLPNNQTSEMEIDGVFVAIGHTPNSKIFEGQLGLDEKGFVTRNSKFEIRNSKFSMMTSVPGVFVAGDVHDHHYKQAVTAAAFGCMAALETSKWLSDSHI
jgi:thioredoxin reductase (NADPH)